MTNQVHSLRILGSGSSTGIPVVGCNCQICRSSDPKDRRLRTSLFLETASGKSLLIDTGPDLREQLLREKIQKIDHVIITHDHADHLHGIDELRPFTFNPKLPPIEITCDDSTYKRLQLGFDYLFSPPVSGTPIGGGRPRLKLLPLQAPCQVSLAGEAFQFFSNPHGLGETLGFIHGGLGYVIDCHEITDLNLQQLAAANLELLIIDCVQLEPHDTHLSLTKALEFIAQINPGKAGLIHMGHRLGHQALEAILERQNLESVFVCYDGQKLNYRT